MKLILRTPQISQYTVGPLLSRVVLSPALFSMWVIDGGGGVYASSPRILIGRRAEARRDVTRLSTFQGCTVLWKCSGTVWWNTPLRLWPHKYAPDPTAIMDGWYHGQYTQVLRDASNVQLRPEFSKVQWIFLWDLWNCCIRYYYCNFEFLLCKIMSWY